MDLTSTSHFVASGALAIIEAETPLAEALAQLARSPAPAKGGFLVRDEGVVVSFVKADKLTAYILERVAAAENSFPANFREEAARECLARWNQTSLKHIIAHLTDESPVTPVELSVPHSDVSEYTLQYRPATIFAVRGFDGGLAGWYLNHERLLAAATPRTIYLCAQKHENTDYNGGYCSTSGCGRRLTGTKTET